MSEKNCITINYKNLLIHYCIMGLFKRKNKDFIDLTQRYKKQQERIAEMQEDSQSSSESDAQGLGFFGAISDTVSNSTSSSASSPGYSDVSEGVEEKRRRLSKRLLEMTNKIEEISNQIYHLQQRLELIERKMNINKF